MRPILNRISELNIINNVAGDGKAGLRVTGAEVGLLLHFQKREMYESGTLLFNTIRTLFASVVVERVLSNHLKYTPLHF